MKILKLGFTLPLILVGLIGCSGSSNSGTYVDVSGVWNGSWVSSRGQSGGLSASFTQDAGTFSGSATIGNSVCFGKEFATGKFRGPMVFLAQGARVTSEHLFCADSVDGGPLSRIPRGVFIPESRRTQTR